MRVSRRALTGIGLVLLSGAVPAHAQQWRAAADSVQAPLTVMFVDEASVQRDKDIVSANVLVVMDETADAPRDWNYLILGRKVDCASKQALIVSSRFFKDEQLVSNDDKASEWIPIREGSTFEGVAETLCGRQDYLSPVLENPVVLARAYFAEVGAETALDPAKK